MLVKVRLPSSCCMFASMILRHAMQCMSVREEEAPSVSRESVSFKGMFSKDLRIMMYGYGDAINPLDETVDLVEVR